MWIIYIYQYISIGNTTYEPWWTWMVSNNMKTQSAPSVRNCGIGPTDLFLLWIGLGSQIHISTPRCFMSIFLLISDGSTPPNIHFNVFAIVVCSIHRDTRTVNDKKMVKKILASHSGSTFMQRYCRRNLLDPFTAPDTACRRAARLVCTK